MVKRSSTKRIHRQNMKSRPLIDKTRRTVQEKTILYIRVYCSFDLWFVLAKFWVSHVSLQDDIWYAISQLHFSYWIIDNASMVLHWKHIECHENVQYELLHAWQLSNISVHILRRQVRSNPRSHCRSKNIFTDFHQTSYAPTRVSKNFQNGDWAFHFYGVTQSLASIRFA